MLNVDVIDAAREKSLLKEWFETTGWDIVSPDVPVLDAEEDDEGRSLLSVIAELSNRKADDIASRARVPDSGFTMDPRTGKDIKEGYAVAIYPDRSKEIAARSINRSVIQQYTKDNQDLLNQQGNMVGAWHDPESGMVWLDVSRVELDRRSAIDIAKEHDQNSIFDLGSGNVINTRGSGATSYPFVFTRTNTGSARHLPGKHNQKDHGFKKGEPKGPPTPAPPKDQSKWLFDQDKDLNEGADRVLAFGDFNDPVSDPLVAIGKRQGFDAKPTKGSVDDTIKNGGVEIHRGLIPHERSGKSSADLENEFVNGQYAPGKGNYGNGYYFSTSPGIAKMYSKAPVASTGYNAKGVSGGRVVRAALKPDAKVAHYEDIQKMKKEWYKKHRDKIHWDTHSTNYIVPKDKISPTVMDAVNDPGHFAAAMGYDAIRVPLKDRPTDRRNRANIKKKIGSDDLGDEIVVLNRGALVVDE